MEFTLPIPQQLAKTGVLNRQWTNFSQRFTFHVNSGKEPELKQTSMLLFASLSDVGSLCDSLKMYDMDVPKLSKILEVVERVCLPRFILLFERFRYFTLEQDTNETLPDFIHILHKQVEICEFGTIKDSLMTSTLVNGVTDQNFKQSLQSNQGLCFSDALTLCGAVGSSTKGKEKAGKTKRSAAKDTSRKESPKKTKASKASKQQSLAKNMYIMPVCDSMNEEVNDDDYMVETIMNAGKKKAKKRRKRTTTAAPSAQRQKSFLCFACDSKYASRKTFRRHILGKHLDCKEFYCKHCNIKFKNKTDIITHCDGHKSTPTTVSSKGWKDDTNTDYICWYCDEVFTNLPDYKKHSLTHSAVRVFSCELCQKKNHTISRMIGHLKGHLLPRLKCEICANCFSKPELLATHMQTHIAQPVHQCQVCFKSFVSADRLSGHMRSHSGEKRFTCELCGKSFSQKVSFDYHKRWHAGEKPYECEICGRRTRSFGDLRKHKRMHSDKRPYVCEKCGKSFRFISSLNRHRKGHSGKRSFVCDVCGRTFIYGEGLRDHIKANRCPGRDNKGEKGTGRAPRARAPHVPPPAPPPTHQHPHPHPPPAQMESDCHPVNYTTTHPHHETLISEFPPVWQYMLQRNSEGETSTGQVVVPPYY